MSLKKATQKLIYSAYEHSNSHLGIIKANVEDGLKALPAACFNVAVTSPPYFWARDYGYSEQIGHEETVEEYVVKLANVFDQVKRVLHPDGVFFLNIGDTYYSGNGQPKGSDPKSPSRNFMRKKYRAVDRPGWDLPKKSLIGVPWKVAFEMQRRGWTLRSSIIWNRVNAFVEPTALDRPYRQYENLFLFSKSRFYSFDRSSLVEEDLWTVPIERRKKTEHNAPFPKELVTRCIQVGSPEGGHVLDPFVGSGTTIEAAADLNRNAVGVEFNPTYVKEIQDRLTAKKAKHLDWDKLIKTIKASARAYKHWAGNKANFKTHKKKDKE